MTAAQREGGGEEPVIVLYVDDDRANLIAYLASLSDAPKPFPAP